MSAHQEFVTKQDLTDALAANNSDLKQFILGALAANNDQLERRFDERLTSRLHSAILQSEERMSKKLDIAVNRLSAEMFEGFSGIADIIMDINDRHQDHEVRITALETRIQT